MRGPQRYRHNVKYDPAAPTDAMPGYAQIVARLALGVEVIQTPPCIFHS